MADATKTDAAGIADSAHAHTRTHRQTQTQRKRDEPTDGQTDKHRESHDINNWCLSTFWKSNKILYRDIDKSNDDEMTFSRNAHATFKRNTQ